MGCSDFWKMDKVDKIVISFIFIFATLFNIFNTFCYASENVSFNSVINLGLDGSTKTFKEEYSSIAAYVQMEHGYSYTITIPETWTSSRNVVLSETIPSVGVSYQRVALLSPGSSFTYDYYSGSSVLFIDVVSGNNGLVITREKIPSFKDTIQLLASTLSPFSLWSVFEKSLPFIGVVVLFAFGFYIIIHNIKEYSKGRDR